MVATKINPWLRSVQVSGVKCSKVQYIFTILGTRLFVEKQFLNDRGREGYILHSIFITLFIFMIGLVASN